jgi:hypothetical protein
MWDGPMNSEDRIAEDREIRSQLAKDALKKMGLRFVAWLTLFVVLFPLVHHFKLLSEVREVLDVVAGVSLWGYVIMPWQFGEWRK